MTKTFVADLNNGDSVRSVFVLSEKALKTYAKGKYLSVVLSDRTGEVPALMWENATTTYRTLPLGKLVQVVADANLYNGSMQLKIKGIEVFTGDYQLEDYVESVPDIDGLLSKIQVLMSSKMSDPYLIQLVRDFWEDDALIKLFKTAPAAKSIHHSERGGLMLHVYEMMTLAVIMSRVWDKLNLDLLLTGILFHDIGKLYEMSGELSTEYTDVGNLLGHICIGQQIVLDKMRDIASFPARHKLLLLHMILSHHGQLEFGSPVVPKCAEAVALSSLDSMSGSMNGCLRLIGSATTKGEKWSEYVPRLDRKFTTMRLIKEDSVGTES